MADAAPTPVINPNLPFTTWNKAQLFDVNNPSANATYFPNVWDLVWSFSEGWFVVTAVDYTAFTFTLEAWAPTASDTSTDTDVLTSASSGAVADSRRIYINKNVTPFTLTFDRRTRIYDTSVTSVKVFKGTDITETGTVISQVYDTNWNLVGDSIPTALVALPTTAAYQNKAIKIPIGAYTNADLNDGDLVTAVAYDSAGVMTYRAIFVIQNTTLVYANEASMKYITSISLSSPFLSPSDASQLLIPLNMPLKSLTMMGVVTYSDGSTKTLPVDGTQFKLQGLASFIATQEGLKIPLVLNYTPGSGEYSYINNTATNASIPRKYSALTEPADGVYSVKLFPWPVWNNTTQQYDLRIYLYDLNRQDFWDVTTLVTAETSTNAFKPSTYNVVQQLSFAVNLNQVDSTRKAWRYVQTMAITLLRPGTDQTGDNWTVTWQDGTSYGVGVKAAATYNEVNNWTLDLTSGETTQDGWLQKMFFNAEPLFDPTSETVAPTPNIMNIMINGTAYEVPVSEWSQALTVTQTLTEGMDIFIEWIYRDNTNDLQLGITGVIVHIAQTT